MVQTEGLILKSFPYQEADRVFTIFTREYGKITARGRGVRKINSKLGPHLLPLHRLHFELLPQRDWYQISSAQLQEIPSTVMSSEHLDLMTCMCTIFLKTLTESSQQDFYDHITAIVSYLLRTDLDVSLKKNIFLFHYLSTTGHTIELDECLICHAKTESGFLSIEHGGIFCDLCIPDKKSDHNILKYLRMIALRNHDQNLLLQTLPRESHRTILHILQLFFQESFHIKFPENIFAI